MYRVRQFWRTLSIKKDQQRFEHAMALLTPEQGSLFTRLQPDEQNHALEMFRRLLEQGENHPDLLVAALLHDVGKLRYRMSSLERVMVVILTALMPQQARRYGEFPSAGWDGLPGWRKAFIVAQHHAEWGAEMAQNSGVSHLTENLIRAHHHPLLQNADTIETSLLHKLWLVDNEN